MRMYEYFKFHSPREDPSSKSSIPLWMQACFFSLSNIAKMAAASMNGRNTPTTTLRVTRPIDPVYSNCIVSVIGLPLSFDYSYFLHYSASFGPILEFRSGEFASAGGLRTFGEVLFQSAASARAMLQQPGLEVDGVVYKFLPKLSREVLSNSKGKARDGAGGRGRRSPRGDMDESLGGNRSQMAGEPMHGEGKRGMGKGVRGMGEMERGRQMNAGNGQKGETNRNPINRSGMKQNGMMNQQSTNQQSTNQQSMKQQSMNQQSMNQPSMVQSMGQSGMMNQQSMVQSMGQSGMMNQQSMNQSMGQSGMMNQPSMMMGQPISQAERSTMMAQGMNPSMANQPMNQPMNQGANPSMNQPMMAPNMINPSMNSSMNPSLNPSTNPSMNQQSMNQQSMNQQLNPSMNQQLNPSMNQQSMNQQSMNQQSMNQQLNPSVNPSVNPSMNQQLNPTVMMVNPSLNPSVMNPSVMNPSMMNQGGVGCLAPSPSCVLADNFPANFDTSMVFGVFRPFGPIAQVVFINDHCV